MPNNPKRDKLYQDIYNAAHAAGVKAGQEAVCTPMVVGYPSTAFGNDVDPKQQTWFVADGVCGFAWVTLRRANHSFCKFLVERNLARKNSYEGGVTVSSGLRTQSMTRNEAYAHAFGNVIDEVLGKVITVSVGSRID